MGGPSPKHISDLARAVRKLQAQSSGTAGPAARAVSSFNDRTGYVYLSLSDLLDLTSIVSSFNTRDGDVTLTAADVTGTGLLTTVAGNLSVDTSINTTPAAVLTIPLTVGTWMVNVGVTVNEAVETDVTLVQGTATATFAGQQSSEIAIASGIQSLSILSLATVTVAGSLSVKASVASGTGTVKSTTNTQTYPKATGYVALRVA